MGKTSASTNSDPNDNDEFQWYVHGDGTVHRGLTNTNRMRKINVNGLRNVVKEGRKEEDILERCCYQILRRVPGISPLKRLMQGGKGKSMGEGKEIRT